MKTVLELGLAAKDAAKRVKIASAKEKNLALHCIAEALLEQHGWSIRTVVDAES